MKKRYRIEVTEDEKKLYERVVGMDTLLLMAGKIDDLHEEIWKLRHGIRDFRAALTKADAVAMSTKAFRRLQSLMKLASSGQVSADE